MISYLSLIIFSFFLPLTLTSGADECPSLDPTWLCDDFAGGADGDLEPCTDDSGAPTCSRSISSQDTLISARCMDTCYCKPSQNIFTTYCGDGSVWTNTESKCDDDYIFFLASGTGDWNKASHVMTDFKYNAETSCEAYGCFSIRTVEDCATAARQIKFLDDLPATLLVSDLNDANKPFGCFYEDSSNHLHINSNTATTVTSNDDNQVYCNCNGKREFEQNTGACQRGDTDERPAEINTEDEARNECLRKKCVGYGVVSGQWSVYISSSGDGSDGTVTVDAMDTDSQCYTLKITFEANNFEQPEHGICQGEVHADTVDPSQSRSCYDIDDKEDCKTAAAADSKPFVSYNLDEDIRYMAGCTYEGEVSGYGFREGYRTGDDDSLRSGQTEICRCPSYQIPDDADCLLENSDPFDSNTGTFYVKSISPTVLDVSGTQDIISNWFNGVGSSAKVTWDTEDPMVIELEFTGSDYKIGALRMEFPVLGSRDLIPTAENEMPMRVSMSTSPEATGNNWQLTNCDSDNIYNALGWEDINRDSFHYANMAWTFFCNKIDQAGKRVKLEITKRDGQDGFYIKSIALVGGVATQAPTHHPTLEPSASPSFTPTTSNPTKTPSTSPSAKPITSNPTVRPSSPPSYAPSFTVIRGKSNCYNDQLSDNIYVDENATFAELASTFTLGAFPMINDFDAEIYTECEEWEYDTCTKPWTIVSTFRLSVGYGYTGFELWEEDDQYVKWNQITIHGEWPTEDTRTEIDPATGQSIDRENNGDCRWPTGENTYKDCDLLPLTAGSQQYAIRFEMTCDKRPFDRRKKPFMVAWRDGTGVQYVMRPEVNYTLAEMRFSEPPVGTDYTFKYFWTHFGLAFAAVLAIIFFLMLLFCFSICMESKRQDHYDFIVDTKEFNTDTKQAMRYMPKSVFADELKPLQEKSQEYKGDECLVHCYATYKKRDKINGDECFKLKLWSNHNCKEEFYIGDIVLYKNKLYIDLMEGERTFENGDKYSGTFRGDQLDGHGTYKWVDGSSYTGDWEDGHIHGQGTYTFPNGDKYDGRFSVDRFKGEGTYEWFDGSSYTGKWRDGRKHGEKGTYKFPDGTKVTGDFKYGRLKKKRGDRTIKGINEAQQLSKPAIVPKERSSRRTKYACELDDWTLQDMPPGGLRHGAYLTYVGMSRSEDKTHSDLRRKSFDQVEEALRKIQTDTIKHKGDNAAFWIEFRDSWKEHSFEYKPMKSRIDAETAIFWSGQDIQKHCKSTAVRTKSKFAGKRHCPYIVIVVMARIIYMLLFSFTFFYQVFKFINGPQYNTLEYYSTFGSERDEQIFNMSQTIDAWYNEYSNNQRGNSTPAGDQLIQLERMRQTCLTDFQDMYSGAISDEMEQNANSHSYQMDTLNSALDFDENNYLARWRYSEKTCKLGKTIFGAPEESMDYLVKCEESSNLRGISYTECNKRCYQWKADPKEIVTGPYEDPNGIEGQEYIRNASIPRKQCTYTTYYFDTKCCDLHLIDYGNEIEVDKVPADDNYVTSKGEYCSDAQSVTDTGETNTLWDHGNNGTAYTYTTSTEDTRFVMSYMNVRFCSYVDTRLTMKENWFSLQYFKPEDESTPEDVVGSFACSDSGTGDNIQENELLLSVSGLENVGYIWEDATMKPNSNIQTFDPFPIRDNDDNTRQIPIPEAAMPPGCSFYKFGFGNSRGDRFVTDAGWVFPTAYPLADMITINPHDTGGVGAQDLDLEWGDQTNQNDGGYFNLKISFIMQCSLCASWDELCRWDAVEADHPDYCFEPSKFFLPEGGFSDSNCLTKGPSDDGSLKDQKYTCYNHVSIGADPTSQLANLARSDISQTGQTISECFALCTASGCDGISFSRTEQTVTNEILGTCNVFFEPSLTVTDAMIWDPTGHVCVKKQLYPDEYMRRDKTCRGTACISSDCHPYGIQDENKSTTNAECESACYAHGDSINNMCYFYTFYPDPLQDLGGTGKCIIHDTSPSCQEADIFYQETESYSEMRPEGSSLTEILNRTTARLPQFQSPDRACSLNGAIYQVDDILESLECTEFDRNNNECGNNQEYYVKAIKPDREDVDYYTLLDSNCGGVDTTWCIGFSYVYDSETGPHYYRFQEMANEVVDSNSTGWCVENVAAPRFYQPEEMPYVKEEEARVANEQREASISDMEFRYNELLNAFTNDSTWADKFFLEFDTSVDGESYGFGSPTYKWSFSGGNDGSGTEQDITSWVPFNCPGCPSSIEVPEFMSADSISEYFESATQNPLEDYNISNNVIKPDVGIDFIEVPDLWGWVWNVQVPDVINFGMFSFIVLTFDLLLLIYRIWYTSAIAAQLVRGVDVYINPKYLRDKDYNFEEDVCCRGDKWSDMFLSCFLYVHDKFFNVHIYCWRICPYLLLLCNMGIIIAFLIVAYYLISQLIDLETIAGMGVFSAMTVALGTQKLIRNEVLSYQSFYANNYNAPSLQLEIETAISDQLYRQYQFNAAERERVTTYNANLRASYEAFTVSRELEIDLYYDRDSDYYPWVSSNQENNRLIIDRRSDNYGWKPALTDTAQPTHFPTVMPSATSPSVGPSSLPSFGPSVMPSATSPSVSPSLSPSEEATLSPTRVTTPSPTRYPERYPLAEPYDSYGNFTGDWTGFQINLKPQFILGNASSNISAPYWRIDSAKVEFRYACNGSYDMYDDMGAETLHYTIDFLAETSPGDWNWQSYPQAWEAKTLQWNGQSCDAAPRVCQTCAQGYKDHQVRAIRVTFPDATEFGKNPYLFDSYLGYYVTEFTVEAHVAAEDVVIPYIQWEAIYVDPEEYRYETCPNGVTPIFGYFFRGFSRSQWNDQLKTAHGPYVDALRNVMLAPFVILLVLSCVYVFARLCQFVIEYVLIRVDMLRENPYTKIPLVEYTDRWKVVGLDPDNDKHRSKIFPYPEQRMFEFYIVEGRRKFHNWENNDERNFFVRMYDIEKKIVKHKYPKEVANRRYHCQIIFPEEGIYWVEVLYHGLPIGPAFEIEALRDHPSFKGKHSEKSAAFSRNMSEVWAKTNDVNLDLDQIELGMMEESSMSGIKRTPPAQSFEKEREGANEYTEQGESAVVSASGGSTLNGTHTKSFPNNERYEGEFKDDVFHGNGIYYFADGGTYEGDWQNGKQHGWGAYTYPNNQGRCVGEFRNGVAHGVGSFIYADGTERQGNYVNGEFVEGAQETGSRESSFGESGVNGESYDLSSPRGSTPRHHPSLRL